MIPRSVCLFRVESQPLSTPVLILLVLLLQLEPIEFKVTVTVVSVSDASWEFLLSEPNTLRVVDLHL